MPRANTPFLQFIDDRRGLPLYRPGFPAIEDHLLMGYARSLSFVAPITVAALALALPALAEDAIVKLPSTPMPSAGPTVNAATGFCGDPTGSANELIERYSTKPELKQVYKSKEYVAFSDDEKAATVMYTFTLQGQAAHPAAVCRRVVREGDSAVIKMSVVCDGDKDACAKLQNDFNVMTAQMQAAVNQKIAAEKK
jgi:hypothetical protein